MAGEGGGENGCRCVGLTALQTSSADCFGIWERQLPANPRACTGTTLT